MNPDIFVQIVGWAVAGLFAVIAYFFKSRLELVESHERTLVIIGAKMDNLADQVKALVDEVKTLPQLRVDIDNLKTKQKHPNGRDRA